MKLVAMAAARSVVAGLVTRVMLQCVGAAMKTSETQVLSSAACWSTTAAQLRQPHLVQGRCKWAVQSRTLQGGRPVVYADYTTMEVGAPGSLEYRIFYSDESGRPISPWHDIPLHAGDGLYNCVVEIPKETRAKMEVATAEPNTPIKQDTKMGKLRFYPHNINWNYGLLPQTWEDPSHSNPAVENAVGDNDPVDCVEIGDRQAKIGEVLKVKPLAVLAMIDEGELDWKIVTISVDDPKANMVNNTADVEKHFPISNAYYSHNLLIWKESELIRNESYNGSCLCNE